MFGQISLKLYRAATLSKSTRVWEFDFVDWDAVMKMVHTSRMFLGLATFRKLATRKLKHNNEDR